MTKLRCCFCQQELESVLQLAGAGGLVEEAYLLCSKCNIRGERKLWQELIKDNSTRKALEQSEICCTEWEKEALDYKAENIALSGDLECTRKALDVAVDAIKSAKTRLELINNSKFANLNNVLQIQSQCEILKIEKSLEQITATLENKNGNC